MLDARILRHQHDLQGALDKFQAADAIMGVPTTGLELARTQAELSLLVEALDTCTRVLRYPVEPHEPEPFQSARAEAKQLRDQIRVRIPSLAFELASTEHPGGIELRVDGALVPQAAYGVPRRVNPGTHEIALTVGENRQVVWVTVAEGQTRRVALKVPAGHEPPPPSPPENHGPNAWVWGGFGVAALGFTLGTVTGMLAWSERNALDDHCPDRVCVEDEDQQRLDRAYGYANVSTGSFVVGGLGAAVGIGALLLAGPEDTANTEARIRPCGPAGLCLRGSF
jgi:hypothetical protein